MIRPTLLASFASIFLVPLLAEPDSQLAGVRLDATEIADSGSYLVYSYELSNSPESTWGLSSVSLDIAVEGGTPRSLSATGQFFDLSSTQGSPSAPHAEVGPISPDGWFAILSRGASLTWAVVSSRFQSEDSIAPGATESGFGIRSTYLPGVSLLEGFPTVESCCQVPSDTTGGEPIYPTPESFRVTGRTIAPRYAPEEMSIPILQQELATICSELRWIDSPTLCSEMSDSLEVAAARLAKDNYEGAAAATKSIGNLADNNRAYRGGDIQENAYWLLTLNSEHVAAAIVAGRLPSRLR